MNYNLVKKQLTNLTAIEINQLALKKEIEYEFLEAYYMFLYNARTYPSYATFNNLGFFCSDQGSWSLDGKKEYDVNVRKCERYFLRALLLKRNDFSFSNLVDLYIKDNRFFKAKHAIQGSLSLDHTFYNCNAMGCICYEEKNYAEAMKWFREALHRYDSAEIYTEEDRESVLLSYGMCAARLWQRPIAKNVVEEVLKNAGCNLTKVVFILYYIDEFQEILHLFSRVEEQSWLWEPELFTIFMYAICQIVPDRAEEFFRFAIRNPVIENQFYSLKTYKRIYKKIQKGKKPEISYGPDFLYVNGYVKNW